MSGENVRRRERVVVFVSRCMHAQASDYLIRGVRSATLLMTDWGLSRRLRHPPSTATPNVHPSTSIPNVHPQRPSHQPSTSFPSPPSPPPPSATSISVCFVHISTPCSSPAQGTCAVSVGQGASRRPCRRRAMQTRHGWISSVDGSNCWAVIV